MASIPSAQRLIPIDEMILTGFTSRFQQVFNVQCTFSNQNDRTMIQERIFGKGKPLSYPYSWFRLKSIQHNINTYNSHAMGRRGLTFAVQQAAHQYQTVRILPVNFEVEVHYVTDQFDSVDQGSVSAFARRWLLARRFGYLKTTVQYGKLRFGIGTTLTDTVQIPDRENTLEHEVKYETQVTLIIHGYISEPVTSVVGKMDKINLSQLIGLPVKGAKALPLQNFDFPTDDSG